MTARLDNFTLKDQPYTPLFCEENIWLLAKRLLEEGTPPNSLRVLFFSNPDRRVAMRNQRRSDDSGSTVWDYHVVLEIDDQIYDFDTKLDTPTDVNTYFHASFPDQDRLAEEYHGWVRSIPALAYVAQFYSDRSHMHGVLDEAAFPSWPAITPEHPYTVSLQDYWNMEKTLSDGSTVMRVEEYISLREFLKIV